MSKKETNKNETKTKKQVTKKQPKKETKKVRTESFLTGVKKEMKKVRWPLKKEMIKYSGATLFFIIFFALFFMVGDLIVAGIKMLVA